MLLLCFLAEPPPFQKYHQNSASDYTSFEIYFLSYENIQSFCETSGKQNSLGLICFYMK